MLSFGGLAGVIVGLLGFVALGVVLRVSGLLKPRDAHVLNDVLVYVALPALIFTSVHDARVVHGLAEVPLVAWAVTLAGIAAAWLAARLLELPGPVAGGFLLCAAFGNTGYLGYPLARAYLGSAGLVQAIFFDVFGTVVAVLTLGTTLAGRLGHGPAAGSSLKELVAFPPVIALVVALVSRSVPVPIAVSDWLGTLAKMVVPLIMLSVGLSLRRGGLHGRGVPILAIGVIKLLLMPLLAYGLAALFGADVPMTRLLVMEAGMPSMMLGLVLGMRLGLDTDFMASAILVTMLAAVVTVPLAQQLL